MAKCTFQEGAGSPVGVAVPKFIGQLYHDTTGHAYYRSTGLTNADWVLIANEPFVQWAPVTELATWDDAGGVGQVGDYAAFLANADLTSMSRLEFAPTGITSLIVNYCPVLTVLTAVASTGPLATLDVSGCHAIHTLSCANNSITSLDLSDCASLVDIDCSSNQLTSLDLSNHVGLETVQASYNGTMLSLNVSNCGRLTSCSAAYCALTSANVTGCGFLSNLVLSVNQIPSIDLSSCIIILSILLDYNSFTAVNVDNVLCTVDVTTTAGGILNITNNNPPTAAGLLCASAAGGHLTDPARPGGPWTVLHD